MKKSIKFTAVIVAIVIMIGMLFLTSLRQFNSSIERGINKKASITVETCANRDAKAVNIQLNTQMNKLLNIAEEVGKLEASKMGKNIDEFFKLEKDAEDFKEINVVDLNGNINMADGSTKNVKDEKYFTSAVKGQPYISEPIKNNQSGYFVISVPVIKNDVVESVLFGKIEIEKVFDIPLLDSLSREGKIFITDSNGYALLVMDGSGKTTMGDKTATEYFDEKATVISKNNLTGFDANAGNTMLVEVGAEKYYISYHPVNINGWFFVALTPYIVAISEFAFIKNSIITLETSILVCFMLLAVVLFVFFKYQKKKSAKDRINLFWSEERYRVLADSTNDMFLEYDIVDEVVTVNKNYMDVFARGPMFTIDKSFEYIFPKDLKAYKEFWDACVKGEKRPPIEVRVMNALMNDYTWYQVMVVALRNEEGEVRRVVGKMEDISDKLNFQVQAQMDPLTGICNRSSTEKNIRDYIENNKDKKGAMFIIDIDDFKKVNDTYGHMGGDRVLKEVSDILKKSFRETDIIGRLGGDEFVAFMRNVQSREEVERRINYLCRSFAQIGSGKDYQASISASIGASLYPQNGETIKKLYETADKALYEAKRLGKNRGVFYNAQKVEEIDDKKRKCEEVSILTDVFENHCVDISETLMFESDQDFLYFSDIKTYEMYYILAKDPGMVPKRWGDYKGRKCYEVMQNRTEPCEFCNNSQLSKHQYLIRSYKNPISGREYILKDKLVDRCGKTVRIGVAIDTTAPGAKARLLEENADSQRLLNTCLSQMVFENIPEDALVDILKRLCQFFCAEYSYAYCFSGLPSMRWSAKDGLGEANFPEADENAIQKLSEMLYGDRQIIVRDRDEIEAVSPKAYAFLKKGNISSIFVTPIYVDGKLEGIIGMADIKAHWGNLEVIKVLALYISSQIKKEVLRKENLRLKYRDVVTGYLSYEGYMLEANKILSANKDKKYSVWHGDLRNFKFINDVFGFDAGNRILQHCAEGFYSEARNGETFCRVTADNFSFLCYYEDVNEIKEKFERMVKRIQSYEEFTKKHFRVEIVTGVYLMEPEESLSFEEMMNRATMAQKQNKETQGSKIVFYNESVRQKRLREISLEGQLSEALQNKEFVIYIQPQVPMEKGNKKEISRGEALVRWIRDGKIYAYPDEFIQLFEKSDLIADLDAYVFERSCEFLRKLKKEGAPKLCMCVNVSKITLMQPEFISTYAKIKKDYDIDDGEIELEFTESVVVEDYEMFKQIILDIKANGFSCAMDDFGAGQTSLNLLKNIPIDILKIDKMFFLEDNYNERGYVIIENLLRMAKQLNICTVLEGIETMEQVGELEGKGCDYIQGYVYSRPISCEEFTKVLYEGF